jgi:iron complex outermembrane receptor protein
MRILKSFFLILSLVFLTYKSSAQEGILSGTVRDALSGETLPSAFVLWANKEKGKAVDPSGKFSISLPYGEYEFIITAVGYEEVKKNISITKKEYSIDFDLIQTMQKEVVISADIAVGRTVPVAFSNIGLKRIEEELAGREMATLANTTPGTYATRAGGGDGDARVTIRGFSGNNVAVMLDGVPVNDMENGMVYWSNWFGLDLATQTTQIQRGLGASKLVIPAVGGTMNIITRGIDAKRSVRLRQEYSYGAFSRSSFSINSGKTKRGWAFSMAGSFKTGDGWVDGTHTQGFFYYGKIEKIFGKHHLSLYGLGAPQQHEQRLKSEAIALYDRQTAINLGAETTYAGVGNSRLPIFDGGINYNPDVGYLTRYDFVNGQRTNVQEQEQFNGRLNFFHKPQFSVKDVWTLDENTFISTVAYASFGRGGGTRWNNNLTINDYLPDGTVNMQAFYDANSGAKIPLFSGPDYNVNPLVSATQRYAVSNYVEASMNEHSWYGALSTYNKKFNDKWNFAGGVDLRSYRGSHYRKIIDLMGADYTVISDPRYINYNDPNLVKREGDIVDYNNAALIRWGGVFGQVEYQDDKISAFLSTSAAYTGYMRVDYFRPKVFTVDGVEIPVGYAFESNSVTLNSDTTFLAGHTLTSNMDGAKFQSTGWYYRPTATIKAGLKYNITRKLAVFLNSGYLNKAPLFNQIYTSANERFNAIENEVITSFENGWNYKSKQFSFNVNLYYTTWQNKPYPYGLSVPDPLDPTSNITVNIRGMNARHEGVEFDFAYKISDRITFEGLASFGDWIWTSSDTIYIFDDAGNPVSQDGNPSSPQLFVTYDAQGVHVSDAAQTQLGGMLRYEWKNGAYIKSRYTWFDRYYAAMNPFELKGANAARDSWQIPSYGTLEFHAGYGKEIRGVRYDIRGSVFNVLNSIYITDANNNDTYALYNNKDYSTSDNSFNASSAGVFFGQGRWFNVSLSATF